MVGIGRYTNLACSLPHTHLAGPEHAFSCLERTLGSHHDAPRVALRRVASTHVRKRSLLTRQQSTRRASRDKRETVNVALARKKNDRAFALNRLLRSRISICAFCASRRSRQRETFRVILARYGSE